jgi:hypothetical protein
VFGWSRRAGDMLKIALLPWKERKNLNVSPESFHVHWNAVRCMRTFELSLCSRFTISNLCELLCKSVPSPSEF